MFVVVRVGAGVGERYCREGARAWNVFPEIVQVGFQIFVTLRQLFVYVDSDGVFAEIVHLRFVKFFVVSVGFGLSLK